MTEREREGPLPDADRLGAPVGQSADDPRSAPENAETPADQAIGNQEQALESGEENVV
jgi:hypothetical protein